MVFFLKINYEDKLASSTVVVAPTLVLKLWDKESQQVGCGGKI